STKQHMKGMALTQFLLERVQSTFYWDNVPMPSLRVQDLDADSLRIFRRRAENSRRMSKEDLDVPDEELLRALGIMPDGVLTRAAALLFHAMPEQWFPGAYTKIAYFPNDADIAYMDEVHGSLFQQAERIPELLYLKYMKGSISYQGVQRVESYPFPREALREAILNALIHSSYSSGIPVQIRVYEDKIYISNSTIVMNGWTLERYQCEHCSKPFNPSLANAFYRSGFVESWGRGIEKICRTCSADNTCIPSFEGRPNSFMVSFCRTSGDIGGKGGNKDMNSSKLSAIQQAILVLLGENNHLSSAQIAAKLGVSRFYISRQLTMMQKANILRHTGMRSGGAWHPLI
ncbi:MAG: ATP-binding protein, partial [Akkermansia sp.]